MFKDKGYKIITIDFRHPELSNKFNILQPIINEYKQYIKYDNDKTNLEKKIDELNNLNIELKIKSIYLEQEKQKNHIIMKLKK